MFSSMGMCFTAVAPNIDFFNYPGFLFITPMFLLSNTFFPISSFPQVIQSFAVAFLPLVHQVVLTRGLVLGNLQSLMLMSMMWITIVTLFFFVLSINLMKRRLIK